MSDDVPVRCEPDNPALPEILDLVTRCFAFMETRIDPPSSMLRMTTESIRQDCRSGEVWALGTPPYACVFLKQKEEKLYIGKLAVDESVRGQGFARQLVDLAEKRAAEAGIQVLELETRVQLTENHETFQRLGFQKTGEGTHEGYSEPTFIIMQKSL